MPTIGVFALVIVASLTGMAVLGSAVPLVDEDPVALELKKDCRTYRERARADGTAVLPADWEASCRRLGF